MSPGLFRQDVLAATESFHCQLNMGAGRSGDDHGIDPLECGLETRKRTHGGKGGRDILAGVLIEIDRDNFSYARKTAQDPNMLGSPVAAANDSDA